MSGKKGRSGRRAMPIEMRRRAIIDKAWAVVDAGLSDPKVRATTKLDNACRLAVKDMPTEIRGGLIHAVQMPTIQKGGEKLEFGFPSADQKDDPQIKKISEENVDPPKDT